ncbi:quinolinate synthase NadA, partial [Nitrospira sp. BLG_2]|uniref:quinolinate synthase NadA n=1 Tax=Nitrospira sp. BLG_2 TaxID=3397507 RepID=UPI003B9C9616
MTATEILARPITEYQTQSAEELYRRTAAAKSALGERVMILGHNYQRDEVIQHADFRGDSLLLAKLAAE